MYSALYVPPAPASEATTAPAADLLTAIAREFSPRYQRNGDRLIAIDVSGLGRLLGPPDVIGRELRREAASRGVYVHVALARAHTAARLLALARPGLTVAAGEEATRLAAVPLGILEKLAGAMPLVPLAGGRPPANAGDAPVVVDAVKRWGLKTLGELAALPADQLAARLGRAGALWQALARGEDARPFVPDVAEERFEGSMDLEWPIEGLEPLSFVLTRLLEPLSLRLERHDRGAARLHVELQLVANGGREVHARQVGLPSPVRDVRTLRTLALLDLESHPPGGAVERVSIVIDPTPGRALQYTLFTRAQATPEQLSTLLARLGALMGSDRIGAPAAVDSYRPGAFDMVPFAARHDDQPREQTNRGDRPHADQHRDHRDHSVQKVSVNSVDSVLNGVADGIVTALRRCRRPVPARVTLADGRPTRVTTDRQGFGGGAVLQASGPWRTSGEWWMDGGQDAGLSRRSTAHETPRRAKADGAGQASHWDRDEWDVALGDAAVYRIFQDRATSAWFIDGIFD